MKCPECGYWTDILLMCDFSDGRGMLQMCPTCRGTRRDDLLTALRAASTDFTTPRRLTRAEAERLHDGLCPKCQTPSLIEGPHGGLSINVGCSRCGAVWNDSPIAACCELVKCPVR